MKVENRFWAKIKITSTSCWIWTGATNWGGYGVIEHNYKTKLAHRISWELNFGQIPKSINVLHKCDNPICVNPAHLFLGSQQDNINDMYRRNRQNNIGKPKLSTGKILKIKAALAKGQRPVDISPLYNVTPQYISQLRTFTPRNWDG